MAEEMKSGATPPPPPATPAPTASQSSGGSDKDIEENRVLAGLSYLWVISIIAILIKKDSKFVMFHAKQGLILFVASIIVAFIPWWGLSWILNLVILVLAIMGLVKALNKEWYKVPVIGDLAEKIKL